MAEKRAGSQQPLPTAARVYVAAQICRDAGLPITASEIAKQLNSTHADVERLLSDPELDAVIAGVAYVSYDGDERHWAKATTACLEDAEQIYADARDALAFNRRPPPVASPNPRRPAPLHPRRPNIQC